MHHSHKSKAKCTQLKKGLFVKQKEWMFKVLGMQGRILCPTKTCAMKVGAYDW